MCGIAGAINVPRLTEADVAGMIDTIRYRGPDEQDVVQVGPCLLGHARLAVVDPENGGQPMSNTDDTVWVVFNGEIYNFVDLREDLKAKGYVFKSRCDTEVLVHLWREKGVAMLDDLIGMFAFCLWDTRAGKGILARDRQGIKPCYIMDMGNGFVFGSEIKAILSLPGVAPPLDDVALNLLHVLNYCPPPRTCYQGITHLEPGSYLSFDATGAREKVTYWSWPLDQEKRPVDHDALAALLDDAIRLQMRFDVEGCLFLSGGVDSSVIAAHLRKQWNRDSIRAYALDTKERGFGEYHLADRVARDLGIDLTPIQYDWNIVPDTIADVLHHNDQPHGDFSFFLIRALCAQAHADGVIVAFNGDGPDEALSGFSHNEAFFADQTRLNFPLGAYFERMSFMPRRDRERLLTPDFAAHLPDPIAAFEQILAPWRGAEPVDQVAAYECTALGPGNNLIKTDRMGAGLAIEGRSPFMDHRISEMLARAPAAEKQRDGIGKYVLKDYALRHFPRDHIFRPKSMPTMPIGEWIKDPLRDWARARLDALDPVRYDRAAAFALFDDHVAGRANHTRPLRTLLMVSEWMARG
ncbi:MAG: asparagine synthase (glutamine-hydrolyzing) [Pseudomonadota bacterium]